MSHAGGLGYFGDARLQAVGVDLHAAMVKRPGSNVRRIAGGVRSESMRFHRFLHNDAVEPEEMAACAGARTGARVEGRRILAIQDTSELVFGGKRARERGFGPIGRGGALGGLCLHAILAVDAVDGALIGLVHMEINNRSGGKVSPRSRRAIEEKESQRWLDGAEKASQRLAAAREITVVSDSEADIYESFVHRPADTHLITRVARDRRVRTTNGERGKLFAFTDALPEATRLEVHIKAAPGRAARDTILALRFAPVLLCRPKNRPKQATEPATGPSRQRATPPDLPKPDLPKPDLPKPDLPKTVPMWVVDVRETTASKGVEPIHWRLLTSHRVESCEAAKRILRNYRSRWTVEEYFRTTKTAAFDIEASQIETPAAMRRLVGAVACSAVTVMQLVRARDGGTDQALEDAFDPDDRELLERLSRELEGRTKRLKNPNETGTLAFASWVIARLGCWDCYYGKPGPKVMRRGLEDFYVIKYGHDLGP